MLAACWGGRRGWAVARWCVPAAACATAFATTTAAAATPAAASSSVAAAACMALLLADTLGTHAAHCSPLCLGIAPKLKTTLIPPPIPTTTLVLPLVPPLGDPRMRKPVELKHSGECEDVLDEVKRRPRTPVGEHKRQREAGEAGECGVNDPREAAAQQRAEACSVAKDLRKCERRSQRRHLAAANSVIALLILLLRAVHSGRVIKRAHALCLLVSASGCIALIAFMTAAQPRAVPPTMLCVMPRVPDLSSSFWAPHPRERVACSPPHLDSSCDVAQVEEQRQRQGEDEERELVASRPAALRAKNGPAVTAKHRGLGEEDEESQRKGHARVRVAASTRGWGERRDELLVLLVPACCSSRGVGSGVGNVVFIHRPRVADRRI